MPHSVKCLGRIPRTMHNFLRGHISDGVALKYGGDNLSLYQRDPLYDLEAQRVSIWPIPGGPNDNVSLWALARFDVMVPFEEQEMEVLLRVYQRAGCRHHRVVFRWRISYGKPAGDDLLAIWPEAKGTLNKFLQQCYMLRPGQIIPHDGYTQAEVAEIGKQNLERMQKILGGFN